MVDEGDILVQSIRVHIRRPSIRLAKKRRTRCLKDAQLNLQRYASPPSTILRRANSLDTQQAVVDQLIAQIRSDQAAIYNAQTQVGYTTIRSPPAKRVSALLMPATSSMRPTRRASLQS
jgi:multidrug efflux system membrane fusion protein